MSENRGEDQGKALTARGPIAWMARNSVAANLLMVFFILGGLIALQRITREVFPDARLDVVTVSVPYPGATPVDVEEGVILPVEEAMRGIDGIDAINATAREGLGRVVAELQQGADENVVLNDVESAVNRITSFPEAAEEPVISLPSSQRQVLSVILYGRVDRHTLSQVSERIRADLLRLEEVSQVNVRGQSPPEIGIEVSQAELRRYGLTLPEIAARVDAATQELSAGTIRSPAGQVAVRILQPREWAAEFGGVPVVSRPDGTLVLLKDLADIKETFRTTELEASFNGSPAVSLDVFRGAGQSPVEVAKVVRDFIDEEKSEWGERIHFQIWNDQSVIYQDRVGLLMRNGAQGLALVLILLGLFLKPKLAFWVTMGIPISFLGAFLFMPMIGVSINMISLFSFILVLGIVVDDAIVVGEAAFQKQSEEESPLRASVAGAHEVRTPVIFAVTTTILVFVPMLFVPGVTGEFFGVIPKIVIPILFLSLIESLLILPAHISHIRQGREPRWIVVRKLTEWQDRFSSGFEKHSERFYRPLVRFVLKWRYAVLAAAFVFLAAGFGLVAGKRLGFVFMPKIEGEIVRAQLEMPSGTSFETTQEAEKQLVKAARTVVEREKREDDILRGIFVQAGTEGRGGMEIGSSTIPDEGANLAIVEVGFVSLAERNLSSEVFSRLWREEAGEIAGAQRISYSFAVGSSAGATLAFQLSHEQEEVLRQAASELTGRLGNFAGVTDLDRGFDEGKEEVRLRIAPAGRALGLTEADLTAQVRGSYFGIEAFRQQRGRDELRVYVRLPETERASLESLETMVLRTPGGEIPLDEAAEMWWERAPTKIERENGRRIITVTGDVDPRKTTANEITARATGDLLPELQEKYPGLDFEVGGEQEDQAESMGALMTGMMLAFLAMYGLMATVFQSYYQPLLIFLAIPFGWVGALFGHLFLGYDLSILSMFGMVALSGVVVNDSLVLIDAVNRRREGGKSLNEALEDGGLRRLRPIVLTSLTTFLSLTPMITETSLQARFLIPMAISLGIGVLFVTGIALVIVPAAYRILEDVRGTLSRDGSENG